MAGWIDRGAESRWLLTERVDKSCRPSSMRTLRGLERAATRGFERASVFEGPGLKRVRKLSAVIDRSPSRSLVYPRIRRTIPFDHLIRRTSPFQPVGRKARTSK